MHSEYQARQYIVDIQELGKVLGKLSHSFRNHDPERSSLTADIYSADNWRRNTYGNILVRLRQIADNNFQVIETLSLLVSARYVFEASIWLKLFELNMDYSLIYYKELLKTQLRYYEDTLAQLRREIAFLKRFGEIDQESSKTLIEQTIESGSVAGFGSNLRSAMDRVDAEAARCFSIFSDQAKTNGYGYQAYLVEHNVIPPAETAIANIESDISKFEREVPDTVQKLLKGRWQWREMSKRAGMLEEHDYIYSYASKLIHATPASITTDQKNLEIDEVCVFLRYIHFKLLEIIDLASSQPEGQ